MSIIYEIIPSYPDTWFSSFFEMEQGLLYNIVVFK